MLAYAEETLILCCGLASNKVLSKICQKFHNIGIVFSGVDAV